MSSKTIRFSNSLTKLKRSLINICRIGISVDAGINAKNIYESMSFIGDGFIAFLIAALFFVFWVVSVSWLVSFGVEVLADADEAEKKRVLPYWASGMLFALLISVWMSASTLGTGIAENEYLENTTHQVSAGTSDISNAVSQLVGMETVFQTAFSKAESMYKSEVENGGVSSKAGHGEVATMLKGFSTLARMSDQQLVELSGRATPIERSILELEDELRRIRSRDIPYQEKVDLLVDRTELLIAQANQLQGLIRISILTTAIDAYGQDFRATNFPIVASQRLTSAFSPIAQRLSREIAPLRETSLIELPTFEALSTYELLSRSVEVRPIIAIALLLSAMPLLLSMCVLLVTPRREETPSEPKPKQRAPHDDIETTETVAQFLPTTTTKH